MSTVLKDDNNPNGINMVKFIDLWDNHPTILGDKQPCKTNGKANFDDQCAIRLGASLQSAGIDTAKIPGARHCWYHKKSEGHVLAAEELAKGLSKTGAIPQLQKIPTDTFQCKLTGRKGIIFFKDYWNRKKDAVGSNSGDHIDLWNGERLTDWKTWFLISCTLNTSGAYSKSKEIWFWEFF